jgi:DNA gyrase subunit A
VQGIRLRPGDSLLAAEVVTPEAYLVTVTDGGYAKRTEVSQWLAKGRNTFGVRAVKLVDERGGLVGALICAEDDGLFAMASNGVVIRTDVSQIRSTGRDTMGVSLMGLPEGVEVVAVARSAEGAGADHEPDDGPDDDEGPDGESTGDLAPQGSTAGGDPQ